MAFVDPTQDPQNPQNSQSGAVVTGGAPQATGATSQTATASSADQPTALPGSGGGVLSPGSNSGASGASSPATGQGPAKPSGSGSWTNLQSYLDANSGQAAQMGNTLAGTLNSEGQGAKAAVDQAQGDFTTGLNSSGADLGTEKGFIDQAVTDPTKAAGDSSQSSHFKNDFSGAYTGPKALSDVGSDYTNAQNQVSQTSKDLALTQNESGRGVLLQNQYGKAGNYNQGEQNLDQLLLEGNPDAQSALQGAASQWSGLSDALTSNASADSQAAAARAASTQAVNDYAKSAVTGAQGNIQSAVNSQVTQNQQALQNLTNDLNAKQLSPEEMAMMGINSPYTYSSDPYATLAQYLGSPGQINAATVATPEQQANYAALAKLSGQTNDFLPYADQAGKYTGPYDSQGLAQGIAQNQSAYSAAAEKALANYNAVLNADVYNGLNGADIQGKYPLLDRASFDQQVKDGGPAYMKTILAEEAAHPGDTDVLGHWAGADQNSVDEINNLMSSYGLNQPLWGSVGAQIAGPHGPQVRRP